MIATLDHIAIPTTPGPAAERKLCASCGRILADVWRGWVFVCHKRRKYIAQVPVVVICECGASNTVSS
jgi:hypothetical protein